MEETLTYIVFAVFFVPLVTGLIRWDRLSTSQKVFVAFIGFVILSSIAADIMARIYGNNLILFHVHTFVEFFVFLYLFRKSMRRIPSLVFLIPAIVFVGIGLFGIVRAPFELPVMLRTAEGIILIILSLLFFYNALRHLEFQRIERTFMFWISVAVLLDFAGSMLLDVFGNYIANASDNVYFTVWTIHTILNIPLYILYSIGLLWPNPIPQSSQSLSSVH